MQASLRGPSRSGTRAGLDDSVWEFVIGNYW